MQPDNATRPARPEDWSASPATAVPAVASGGTLAGASAGAPVAATAPVVADAPAPLGTGGRRRLSVPTWLTLLLSNPLSAIGIAVLIVFVLAAIFAPLLTPYDPNDIGSGLQFQPPGPGHPFGTDYSGDDVFTKVLYGARVSLVIGAVAGFVATFLSIVVGLVSGYLGGLTDDILSLVMNIFLVIPQLPLLLVFSAYVPVKGSLAIIIVISITGWAWGARVMRAQTLSLRNRDFVQAAYMSGESTPRIIFTEIMPNMISLIVSSLIFAVIGAIFTDAALEFLGLGDASVVSWGTILRSAQQYAALTSGRWWNFLFPGLAIALTVTACVFINYGIDTISNPRLRTIKVGKAYRKAAKAATASARTGAA